MRPTMNARTVEDGETDRIPIANRPYIRLWAAVFQQGISDACTARAKGEEGRDLLWFYSNANTAGSFNWLCELFSIEPDKARARIMENWRTYVDRSQIMNRKGAAYK